FVQARDPDGDILSWSISLTGTDWTDWVGEPILKNTGVNNQIEIYADQAGANKSYSIAINVRDNRGGEVTKIFAINVGICTDGDEDGFFSEGGECGPVDCDDENEDIYPGAAETCDGADNNCDGVRDEGCQVIVTYCGDNTIQDDSQNDDGVKEKCDGGNAVSGDGCNENCQIERIIVTFCGDGEIQNNPDDNLGIAETCDDGNTINDGNGCDENCQCASGYHRDGSNCVINSGTKACGSKTELNSAWYGTGTFNQTWNNGIYYPETWASTYSLTDTPSDQCDYHCVDSYHYTSTPAPYGSCVTNSETGDCSGEPLNSVWWDGVGKFTKNWINNDWSPLSKQGSYSAATTVTECAYKCADNFVWQDPLCVPACQGIAANSIILNDGVINSENTVYSDNNDTDTAIRVDGGNYLKLGRSLPTPYLWIANTDINKVAKIRTFEGPQRQCRETGAPYRLLSSCNWVTGIANEPMGKLIGTYSVGADPSRTAVNAETGDVWIGNRKDGSVTKLTINGNPLKVCSSSDAGVSPVFKYGTPGVMYPGTAGEVKYPKGLIRGVAIDEAGDVWLADYFGDRLIKIPGGDTGCTPIAVVTNVLQPYGLSIDSDNNVWAVQAFYGVSKVSKNPVTGTYTVVGYPSGINGGYGITVDMDDNIWTGGHASPGNGATTPMNGYALIKYPKDTPNRPEHFIPNVSGLGVSIDLLGNIWVANYKSPSVYRINPNNTADISGPFDSISQSDINDRLIPKDSRGVAGDSQGNMWVVNYETGKIRALNSVGGFLGDYNAYKKRPTWPITEFSRTYSYSDMTGLNRAMIFRTAYWVSKTFVKLPAFDNYYWGETDFNLTIPILDKTSAKVFIQTNSDPACSLTNWPVGSESQYTKAEWNALPKASRKSKCLRIKIELSSKAKGITPVFSASESSLICN
ncbi:MAG: MopE-related protein, partial [bacterium]|nr:MopE-related protein [bacterium]